LNQYINIKFQRGPVNEAGVNGCQVEDVIDFLVAHLRDLNVGLYCTQETSLAITSLQEADNWLHRRTRDRIARGVEGTSRP